MNVRLRFLDSSGEPSIVLVARAQSGRFGWSVDRAASVYITWMVSLLSVMSRGRESLI